MRRRIVLWLAASSLVAAPQSTDQRLAEARKQIDAVDADIVRLLNQRAAIVKRVGEIKKEAGLPVTVPAREQQVLDRAVERGKDGPLPGDIIRRIYQKIVQEMRDWEASPGR